VHRFSSGTVLDRDHVEPCLRSSFGSNGIAERFIRTLKGNLLRVWQRADVVGHASGPARSGGGGVVASIRPHVGSGDRSTATGCADCPRRELAVGRREAYLVGDKSVWLMAYS